MTDGTEISLSFGNVVSLAFRSISFRRKMQWIEKKTKFQWPNRKNLLLVNLDQFLKNCFKRKKLSSFKSENFLEVIWLRFKKDIN
uniref:Uncharacterized protein n=1 Tax=Romanomermis culicivorax TaxID=13658 RepID=A0A915HYP7_ROMCU